MPVYHGLGDSGPGSDPDAIDWQRLQQRVKHYNTQSIQSPAPGEPDFIGPTAPAPAPQIVQRGQVDWSALWNRINDASTVTPSDAYVERVTPSFKQLINNRTTKFQNLYWQTTPYLWGQLVTSRYREDLIDKLAEHIPNMDKWIRTQNSFAGISGGLVKLRVQALNIHDPVIRAKALQEVDTLTSMSTEDQQAFLAYARGGGAVAGDPLYTNKPIVDYEGRNVGAGGTVVTPADLMNERAPSGGLTALLGSQFAGVGENGEIQLHAKVGEDAALVDPVQAAALKKMFPQLFDEDFGRVVSAMDVARSVADSQAINEAAYTIGTPIQQAMDGRSGIDASIAVAKNPLAIGESIVNTVGALTGAVIKPVSVVGGAALRNSHVAGSGTLANVFGAQARQAERVMSGVSTVAGDMADYAKYKVTGEHLAPETKQFIGNVALIVILHEAAEGAGAIKTTLSGPAEFTQGELGFRGGTYSDVLSDAAHDPVASALHPFKTFVDPMVQQSVFNMVQLVRSTALEDWVTRGASTKFFSYIESQVKTLGKDDALAAIQERYPALSRNPGWAEDLVDAADSGRNLAEATINFSKQLGLHDVTADLAKNVDAIKATQAQIEQGGEGIDTTAQTVELAKGQVPTVEDVARANAEGRALKFTGYHGNAEGPITPTVEGGGGLSSYAFDEGFSQNYAGGVAENVTEHTLYANKVWDLRADATGEVKSALVEKLQERGVDVDAAQWAIGGKQVTVRAIIDEARTLEDIDKISPYIGPRAVTSMQDLIGATSEGGNIGGVNPSDIWMRDTLKDMGYDGEIRSDLSQAGGGEEFRAYRDLYEPVGNVPLGQLGELYDKLTDLQAEHAILRAHQTELYSKAAPIYEFPTQRSLTNFFHKVLYRPVTVSEKIMRFVLNPLRDIKSWTNNIFHTDYLKPSDQAFVSKLVDKIGNDDRLKAPMAQVTPGARAAANDMNVTYLNRLMQRFGVGSEDATAALSKVVNAKSTQEFWEAVTGDVFGKEGVLSKYLPKNTPKAWADSFLNRYDVNSFKLRGYNIETLSDGTQRYVPLIPGDVEFAVPQSLPGAPSEFASYVPLPTMTELDRILSGYRRLSENLKNAERMPRISGAVSAVMNFGEFSLHATTSVLKPIALLANLPAIIMTKQLDEALGNVASPNLRSIMRAGREADSLVGPIDPAITGNAIAGAFHDNPAGVPVVGEVALRDILKNGIDSPPARLVWDTRAKLLNDLHDDWFYRGFVEDGFDVAKFKARIDTDPIFARHYNENLKPVLDRSSLGGFDEYLSRLEDYVREVTFDHPDFLNYVRSGHMSPGGAFGEREWHGQVNDVLAQHWTDLQEEAGLAREALAKLDRRTEGAALRAHQARLKDILEETDDVEQRMTEFGGIASDKVATITRERPSALANDIKKRFDAQEINLPNTVKVDTVGKAWWGHGSENALEMADGITSRFSKWIYGREGTWAFRRIGEFEGKYARGSFYEQRALQYAKGFANSGMKAEDALEFGRLRAGMQARDVFYDLTARSTTERGLRNVFWFAPVNAELLYRWLYAIPSQAGGMVPGLLITAARGAAWMKLLDQVGVIHTNEDGEKVLPLSGLGNLIETVTGGKVKIPDTLELPLASLNPHLSSPLPQLSPLPGTLLNKAAESRFGDYAPVLKSMAHYVAPHAFTTFVPSSIRNTLAIAGVKLPDFSPNYVNQQWDRTHDIALQYAYHDLAKQGELAPDLSTYHRGEGLPSQNEQDAYLADYNTWYDKLTSTANEYARGLYTVSALSSAVTPGYIVATDADKQAYQKWYEDKIQPQIELNNGVTSNETRAKMNNWLSKHPESLAYSISYGYYTGKTWTPDLAKTDSDYYTSLYLHGVKATMSPEEYGPVLAALTSKAYYDAKTQGQLNRIAPDGSPATMLRNWGERSRAVLDNRLAWQNYKFLHPDVDGILREHSAAMAEQYGIPTEDIERTYVQNTLLGLQSLAGAFTGEDKLPIDEYRTTIARLKELNSKLYGDTNGDLTPMEQGVSWYFDNVLDPYFTQTDGLYEKAQKLDAAGLSTADVYRKIDKVKEQFQNPLYGGEKYPGIDEFFWGTKNRVQQRQAMTGWMTKPVSWLSSWQRSKVGYGSFQGEDQMFNRLAELDEGNQRFIQENNISPGSKWMESLDRWTANKQRDIANDYGKAGLQTLQLEQASPYERLRHFNYGTENDSMVKVYKMVDYTQQALKRADLSPGGYSEYALDLKGWVYDYIAKQEDSDPEFLNLMQRLSFSTAPMQGASFHPTGVPLWEAIFYGNYNPSFIPQSLIESSPQGRNVI